jgi:hypothetical protein
MTNAPITATALTPDNVKTNLSTIAASQAVTASNGVTFSNTGNCVLLVTGSVANTATVVIGSTVLGQAVTNFTVAMTGTVNVVDVLGPFHSALNAPGTNTVTITFSAACSVGLVQIPGVY